MVLRLSNSTNGFSVAFDAFVMKDRDGGADVSAVVREVIAAMRAGGMGALKDYTQKFDGFALTENNLRVTAEEIDAAEAACDKDDLKALDFAAARIRAYHEKQIPSDVRYTDDQGVTLGWRWTCVDAAGLYAPGGRAAYPSSVLMNAIPAKVAGVNRLAMVTPAPGASNTSRSITSPSSPSNLIVILPLPGKRKSVARYWSP